MSGLAIPESLQQIEGVTGAGYMYIYIYLYESQTCFLCSGLVITAAFKVQNMQGSGDKAYRNPQCSQLSTGLLLRNLN